LFPFIFFEDKQSLFYLGERRGQHGKKFIMIKFRSMYSNKEHLTDINGRTYRGVNDVRITKVGRIIRKLSIDELPQIINILKGDMSFIGPRPTLFSGNYDDFNLNMKKRLEIKPGITGYSQAFYRNSIDQNKKFELDCYYVDNLSFLLDIKIIFKTIIAVIKRENIYTKYQTNQSKKNISIDELLPNKRLLLMGGNAFYKDIKRYAEKKQIYLIAVGTDINSNLSKISDEFYLIDTQNITELVKLVNEKKIDGIFVGASEVNIKAAIKLSEETGVNFYCTQKQWNILGNKDQFKELAKKFNIPVINDYDIHIDTFEKDIKNINFPDQNVIRAGLSIKHTEQSA
jgi:lipopolysaccharide/colanic/teichoic acid biosynthesis glycosyltransferase